MFSFYIHTNGAFLKSLDVQVRSEINIGAYPRSIKNMRQQ